MASGVFGGVPGGDDDEVGAGAVDVVVLESDDSEIACDEVEVRHDTDGAPAAEEVVEAAATDDTDDASQVGDEGSQRKSSPSSSISVRVKI